MDAKNRSFLGALAAAIKAFCMLFIRGVSVADKAVSMADKAVTVARKKQTIDMAINMQDYATKAREAAALRQVKQELAMREFIGNDDERRELVKKAREQLDAVIKQELAELEQPDNDNL